MNTIQYLDAVREKLDINTEYGLAKQLGVSRAAVRQWTNGICGFNDDTARRIAEILGMNPALVIIDMHRENAKSAETKAIWQTIFEGFPSLLPHAKTDLGLALLW